MYEINRTDYLWDSACMNESNSFASLDQLEDNQFSSGDPHCFGLPQTLHAYPMIRRAAWIVLVSFTTVKKCFSTYNTKLPYHHTNQLAFLKFTSNKNNSNYYQNLFTKLSKKEVKYPSIAKCFDSYYTAPKVFEVLTGCWRGVANF